MVQHLDGDEHVDDTPGPVTPSRSPACRPPAPRGDYGAYINFEQNVTADLKVFLNVVVADDRTSTTDRQVAAGVVYTGLFDAAAG